jgi:hypothetical protein
VHSRALRIALLLYLFLWFGIIVPGHRRGVVTLEGKPDDKQAACDCCCDCHPSQAPASSKTPPKPTHCAICDFAAHLSLPPVFDFSLAPLGMLTRLPTPPAEDRFARVVVTPYDDRGPPSA